MDIDKSINDSVSKYDHIRNKLSIMMRHRIYRNIEAIWSRKFPEQGGRDDCFQYH